MLQNYFKMLGRRMMRWGMGAGVALLFFVVAGALGLPQWAVLAAGIVGAIVGSIVAMSVMRRLFGEELLPPEEPAPRRRGSGRRGA
jgi:ABC-type cobalamin transport system permease subunit